MIGKMKMMRMRIMKMDRKKYINILNNDYLLIFFEKNILNI
jgi:hypothetical protein